MELLKSHFKLCVLIVTLFVVGSTARTSPELKVTLPHGGGVKGQFHTCTGRGILAYPNIPYAEAPIGPLRFAEPVKKAPWNGYLPPNKNAIQCVQQMPTNDRLNKHNITGSEDCLYLNVYRPNIQRQDLPVMVYIPGGDFKTGSGNMEKMDPSFLLENDAMLVTMNHRLGPLGFLTTPDGTLKGNMGMKDQQMAMQWVRENIGAFGGNPNNVALVGQGSGASSVGMHMFAPNSQGLFQKAVLQSGTPYDPMALTPQPVAVRNGNQLINEVGCSNLHDRELMHCLQRADIEVMYVAAEKLYGNGFDPMPAFGPVLDQPNTPSPFIQAPDFQKMPNVPVMMGITHDEGALRAAKLNRRPDLTIELDERFDDLVPIAIGYSDLDGLTKQKINGDIKQFYLNNTNGGFNWNNGKHEFSTIMGDGLHLAGFDKFVQQRLANRDAPPTYLYQYNYHGRSSAADDYDDDLDDDDYEGPEFDWGVSHGDDYMMQFPKSNKLNRVMSEEDLHFGKEFVRMVMDFVSNGNPGQSQNMNWRPATADSQTYMQIGSCNRLECNPQQKTQSVQRVNMFPERAQLWRQIHKDMLNYNGGQQQQQQPQQQQQQQQFYPQRWQVPHHGDYYRYTSAEDDRREKDERYFQNYRYHD